MIGCETEIKLQSACKQEFSFYWSSLGVLFTLQVQNSR